MLPEIMNLLCKFYFMRAAHEARHELNLMDGIAAAQFAAASLNSLVASFNHEVGNHGWCSARASYDHALIAEFLRRGINVSAIYDGSSISFAKPVSLQDNTLIICK